MSSQPSRPVLRYHGGKYQAREWVISFFPPHKVYVEPFGGAASVLMAKPRSPVEIYNDLDERVVNVFRVLRDPEKAAELERRLRLTPWARAEWRDADAPAGEPVEAARRLIVRQMMSFGSSGIVRRRTGFRATTYRNRSQDYAKDWMRYPEAVAAFTERLRGVTIECEPALRVIERHDAPEALLYIDPPYPHATRSKVESSGHNGYRHELTDEMHRALGARLLQARAMVVVSGYACPLYDEELFPGWRREEKRAHANGQGRSVERREVLWINPAAAAALQPTLFDGGAA